MGLYNKQGLYAGYKKNNKEREALDYYATPPREVTNILETLSLNLDNAVILEPCVGGGHMLQGILDYCGNHSYNVRLAISDIKKRDGINKYLTKFEDFAIFGPDADFLSDDYIYNKADYVIMNPPFFYC